ncbi:hypothetical protein Scep_014244 [Stephania cephalantha]|uniref:Uncharacterized protein n=1 Tax=Stephania cephalantha TaxID=152367 RepID=A0AAP0J0Y7_9MAGN
MRRRAAAGKIAEATAKRKKRRSPAATHGVQRDGRRGPASGGAGPSKRRAQVRQQRAGARRGDRDGDTGGLGLADPASQGAADAEKGKRRRRSREGEVAATNSATVVARLAVDRAASLSAAALAHD